MAISHHDTSDLTGFLEILQQLVRGRRWLAPRIRSFGFCAGRKSITTRGMLVLATSFGTYLARGSFHRVTSARGATTRTRGRQPERRPSQAHVLGRTELGRLVAATAGQINGTTLQIPTTGFHTASETALLSSILSALRLLESYP